MSELGGWEVGGGWILNSSLNLMMGWGIRMGVGKGEVVGWFVSSFPRCVLFFVFCILGVCSVL